jgi:hypothetical protein
MVNDPAFLEWARSEKLKDILYGTFSVPVSEIVERWQTFLEAEDRMSWKNYLGFVYDIDGITYLEVYPIHAGVDPEEFQEDFEKNYSLESELFLAPNRNQVRKYLYCKHVDSTGDGFDKHPYRVNA